jgi:hypothetical protein
MCLESRKKNMAWKVKIIKKTTFDYTEYSPKVVGISNKVKNCCSEPRKSSEIVYLKSLSIIAEEWFAFRKCAFSVTYHSFIYL